MAQASQQVAIVYKNNNNNNKIFDWQLTDAAVGDK